MFIFIDVNVCDDLKMADTLFDAFPASSFEGWEQAAKEELHGANPVEKLSYPLGALRVSPIYFPASSPEENLRLQPALNSVRGPRTWYNCPRVTVDDPIRANAEALEHLQQGADGVFFDLGGVVDFRELLNRIEWSFCALSFAASTSEKEHVSGLLSYLDRQTSPVSGAWYGTSIPDASHVSFRFAGLTLPAGASPESTAALLATGLSNPARASDFALRTVVGTGFLAEVCRLRAIRLTWKRALRHLKRPDSTLLLHACSPPWHPENFQPHGNMLKATHAAMTAILGGCDILTIDPEDSSNEMMRRVARNVGNILREESHFNKVADPLAGSYLVDGLTRELADELWTLIQPALP